MNEIAQKKFQNLIKFFRFVSSNCTTYHGDIKPLRNMKLQKKAEGEDVNRITLCIYEEKFRAYMKHLETRDVTLKTPQELCFPTKTNEKLDFLVPEEKFLIQRKKSFNETLPARQQHNISVHPSSREKPNRISIHKYFISKEKEVEDIFWIY